MLTWSLSLSLGPAVSEMNTSARVVGFLVDLFELCRSCSPYEFTYQFFFNCNETTAGSRSGSTKERSRPDTLLTASGCTFLIAQTSKWVHVQEDLSRLCRFLCDLCSPLIFCPLIVEGRDIFLQLCKPAVSHPIQSSIPYKKLLRFLMDFLTLSGKKYIFLSPTISAVNIAWWPGISGTESIIFWIN